MAGIANIIGGTGQAAQGLGSQIRSQDFAHQENALKRLQEQYNYLADAVERSQAHYAELDPSLANSLNDVQMKIRAAHMPGQQVDPRSFQQLQNEYFKAKQEANKAWAVHPKNPANRVIGTQAVQDAVGQATGQIPRVGGVQPAQGGGFQAPPPFQNAITGPPPQPQAAPAAQPATSPVQPAAQGGGNSSPATFPTTPVQPVEASGATGSAAAVPDGREVPVPTLSTSTSGASVAPIVDLDSLLARPLAGSLETGYMSPLIHEALQHQMGTQAALEQKYREGGIGLDLSHRKLQALDEMGTLKDLPPTLRTMIEAGAYGVPVPGIASLAKPMNVPGLLQTSALPPGSKDAYGNVIDPAITPYVRVQRSLLGGPDMYYPEQGGVSRIVIPDQDSATGFSQVIIDHSGNETGRVQGVPPPANLTTRESTQSSPGVPDIHTVTRPSVPGINAPPVNAQPGGGVTPVGGGGHTTLQPIRPPASSGGSTARGARVSSDAYPAAIKDMAKKVESGDLPIPTDMRTAGAVREYMAEHHMDIPTPLTATGQEDINKIDPIMDEVRRVREMVESRKDSLSYGELAKDLVLYKLHIPTPNDDLISSISFAGLRGASQAMSGTGSRAYQVLSRALEHVPALPSGPDRILTLLNEMETRLQEGRASIIRNDRKSGVIMPVEAAPSKSKMIRARNAQGNLHEAPAGTALPAGWKLEK